MEWIKNVWNWIVKKVKELWADSLGLLHALICALVVVFFASFLPVWVAALIAIVAALFQQVYAKINDKPDTDYADLFYDGLGVILGLLITLFWLLFR